MTDGTATRRRAPRAAIAALLVAVLAVGVLVGVVVGRGEAEPVTAGTATTDAPPPAAAPVLADAPPAPAGEAAPGPGADPAGAVAGYLTAEATRDLETAFTYLVPAQQEAFRTPAAYVAAHADLLGTVTGFTITEVVEETADPTRVTVTADVGFEPSLDTVMGLVPARATVTFPVSSGPRGWSVSLADAVFVPTLPSDDQALDDATAIAADAVGCDAPASAYGGELVGQPVLLEELCDTAGTATVTDVTPLDDPLTVQPFLSAFGPEVGAWARVAHLDGAAPLRLVLAPYGDTWTLIGVLPPQT